MWSEDVVGRGETAAVDRIHSSPKYRALTRETIQDVLLREVARHGPGKRAVESARLVLHRVAAFYLGQPDYDRRRTEMEACADTTGRTAVCRALLERHLSTRERLPILPELYAGVFGVTGIPASVADLASACNPFAFPWMGLPVTVRYHAYDINAHMVALVTRYFELEGIAGRAIHQDVLCKPPEEMYDVALLMKMYHCLEHRRKGAGWEVLSAVRAPYVAVSFPSRNLAGRAADIAGNYREEIVSSSRRAGWCCRELVFPGEVVILVRKTPR